MPNSDRKDMHQEILRAAKALFFEQGYHRLAMRQIAEAVGVTKAALYYHFKDKEQLFLAMLGSFLEEIEGIIDGAQAQGGDARQRIHMLVEGILSLPVEQRAMIRLASQEMAHLTPQGRRAFEALYHRKFIQKIQTILQVGIESGELKAMDSGVAVWLLLGMMYPYFYPAHTMEMPPPSEVLDQLLTIYLEGILM
jgi:AcrR family transcriptional regulator